MNEEFLANLSVRSILLSLYRQRRKAIAFAVAVVTVVLVSVFFVPKRYESEGKLFVRLGRGGVTLDPTATTGQTVTILETRESEINSIIDILSSRGLIEHVISNEKIGVDKILETSSILSKIGLPSISLLAKTEEDLFVEEQEKLEVAVAKFRDSLGVTVPRKAATISIWFKSESPELSKLVMDTLMETYIQQHVIARQTDGSHDFFESQFQQQEVALDHASNKLSEFKNEIGVMSIGDRREALRDKISLIESSLINNGSTLAAAKKRLQKSEVMITTIPDQMVLEETTGESKHASDLMRDRLYDLELEEQQLLARYTPEHPNVQAVQAQLREAKSIMSNQIPEKVVKRKGVNANMQAFKLNMMNTDVEAAAVAAAREMLSRKLDEARGEMLKLNEHEIKLLELERIVQVAERNYRVYAEKMEEARINLELDEKQISNVKIVQEGSLQLKHVSPKKGIILLMSMFFGATGGCMLAFAIDRFSGTLHASEDIVSVLKLDLLATVPTLPSETQPKGLTHQMHAQLTTEGTAS